MRTAVDLFRDWQSSVPPRTRLFRLEPIAIGTPEVESFHSYLNRLAYAHGVTLFQMLRSEAADLLQTTPSGRGMAPKYLAHRDGLIERMMELTGRDDLSCLTFARWQGPVNRDQLNYRMRTWCPLCLAENAEYSRLIWTAKCISFCRVHHVELITTCPVCSKKVTASALGFGCDRCLNCMHLLAEDYGPKVAPSHWQHFMADEVAALISLPVFTRKPNSLPAILKFALAATGHKSLAANLRHFGLAGGLFFGRSASTSLNTFFHLAYGLGRRVHELLVGDLECLLASPRPVKAASVRRRERWTAQKLLRLARSALRSDRGISLARLAHSLGVSTTTLHTHCPKLCWHLKKRRLINQQTARKRRKKALVRQVRELRKNLIADGKKGSVSQIMRLLKIQDGILLRKLIER